MMAAMQWALFNQVLVKLASLAGLHPTRDAASYADRLLAEHPHLFARMDGGVEGVSARMAARTIATDHLHEICALPSLVRELQGSLANATLEPSERLVRMVGLAYLVCEQDLISDDLPYGLGFIDDCIVIRGARIGTPAASGADHFADDLQTIAYLSLAVPDDLLADTERALAAAAELWIRTRTLPAHTIEHATRRLIEQPPPSFPPTLELPPTDSEPPRVAAPIELRRGQLVSASAEGELTFEFPTGTLRRHADGKLAFI